MSCIWFVILWIFYPIDPRQATRPADVDMSRLSSYTMYALGGNHLTAALQRVLSDGRCCIDGNVSVDVYVGLTAAQARTLATVHNRCTTSRSTQFREEVMLARTILYELTGRNQATDEPPLMDDITDSMKQDCHSQTSLSEVSLLTWLETLLAFSFQSRFNKKKISYN